MRLYISLHEDAKFPYYLEDGDGYEPASCIDLSEADYADYQRVTREYDEWQQRSRAARDDAAERKEFARLKAKYEP